MNNKVREWLLYTGTYGAIISGIAYLIITWVIVNGFQTRIEQDKQIMFAVLGAIVGLLISFSLRNQGIDLAKQNENAKQTMAEYHRLLNKTKPIQKMHTIKYHMIISTIKDMIFKGATVGLSSYFILFIFMDGNGDFGLFLLAIANIFMFTGFGLRALSLTYDKYLEEHIPVIKAIIERLTIDQVGSVPPEGKEKEDANIQQCIIQDITATSPTEQNGHSSQ